MKVPFASTLIFLMFAVVFILILMNAYSAIINNTYMLILVEEKNKDSITFKTDKLIKKYLN